jgi:hypothetical protein
MWPFRKSSEDPKSLGVGEGQCETRSAAISAVGEQGGSAFITADRSRRSSPLNAEANGLTRLSDHETGAHPIDPNATVSTDGNSRTPHPIGAGPRRKHRSPKEHALLLIEYLQDYRFNALDYLSSEDLQEHYRAMCERNSIWKRPWNPVANQYRKLANGGRRYYRPYSIDGRPRRIRVFHLPTLPNDDEVSVPTLRQTLRAWQENLNTAGNLKRPRSGLDRWLQSKQKHRHVTFT